MNKKILFLILLAVILIFPNITLGAEVPELIAKVKDALIIIGGSIVIIGWIIAGILYLTSAGSPEKTGTAKKALVAAVIGTVLLIIATSIEAAIKTLLGL
jgi:hypothetical protein